ncbi:MAG: hypothetical protein M1817_005137 [Caeruleum heppii]|nr:MAG: hypothetical protein M1817_005137 [Caeruleum heppii]
MAYRDDYPSGGSGGYSERRDEGYGRQAGYVGRADDHGERPRGYDNDDRRGYGNDRDGFGDNRGGSGGPGRPGGYGGSEPRDYREGDSFQERSEHHGRRDDYYNPSSDFSDRRGDRGPVNHGAMGASIHGGRGDGGEYGGRPYGTDDYNRGSSGTYGAGGSAGYGRPGSRNEDSGYGEAISHAQRYAGSSADPSLFQSAISTLSQNQSSYADQDIDENESVQVHKNFYGGGGVSGPQTSGNLGTAAAMQALKMFTGGGAGPGGQGGMGGGNNKNQLIGLAMGQASQLYDQQSSQGNMDEGTNKQDAILKAGEMALKMYMKSESGGSGSGSGGGGGGGAGGLLGMAGKLLGGSA